MPSSLPTPDDLRIVLVPRAVLPAAHVDAVAALCERAYDEDLRQTLDAVPDATHVLGWQGDTLVSHLCWVPRTLAYGGPPARWPSEPRAPLDLGPSEVHALHTAYIELVATEPAWQRQGYATALLRAAAAAIETDPAGYALGVLAPSDPAFYARVGWEPWRGPLFAAGPDGRVSPTPDEEIMILRLPATSAAVGVLDPARPLVAPWREGEVW